MRATRCWACSAGWPTRAGTAKRFLALGRMNPAQPGQPSGMTALALRSSRQANAVSQRHGDVARGMWQPLFPGRAREGVPITHVTNGVHVPTWLHGPMRDLLDRHLGAGWMARADDPETWAPLAAVPAAELWAARCAARAQLVGMITRHAIGDRLRRGEPLDYASAARDGFDPARLTIGFARRLATYKRLHLVGLMPERAIALVGGERPVQFVFAGKAHPDDHEAKEVVRRLFALKRAPGVAGRAAFLEDYDIPLAGRTGGGLRRLGQPAAPAAGSQRHQWHEIGARRRAAAVGAGRLVGRGLRRPQRLGHRRQRGQRPRGAGLARRQHACSTCWSGRWCRCSTSAMPTACRSAGWR